MSFDYHPRGMSLWDPWFVARGDTVHLFHQQGLVGGSDRDPADADAIGHAVSRDLIHWEERPSVLRPDTAYPLEDLWAWTGCACERDGRFYMYYTMRAGAEGGQVERIGVALSEDCERWTRYEGNPVIEPDGRWYINQDNAPRPGRIDCRDLCVVRDEASGWWYGFFATRAPGEEMPETSVIGAARSRDLLEWEQLPPAFAPGTYGTVEVPEVFPLDGRWYLTCLTSNSHGNRPPMSDPNFVMGSMYAVAERPEGPYREIEGDNVLYGGGPPCPHSCRSVLFEGERYVISTQEIGGRTTLSPPMVAKALPDGRLRLAYSPRTQAWRAGTIIDAAAPPEVGDLIPPLGHWSPLLSGAWRRGDAGYVGESRTGWQVADLGLGAENIEIEATVTLASGVAAGIVLRPLGAPEHNGGDLVVGIDAAEQTVFAATLPQFIENHKRRHPVRAGQAYRLRICVRFPRVEVYVDDLLALQGAVGPREFAKPTVGLFVDRGVAKVSDMTAYHLGQEETFMQSDSPINDWSDVLVAEGDEPIITYRSGLTVYEESLTSGRFVGRGWNAAGFINFYDGRLDPNQHAMPQAFGLEMDGQSLVWDWEWQGVEEVADDGVRHVAIGLRHAVRPVSVKVHTKLDGTAILTRWLEVTNTGTQPAALSAVASWSGVLQKTNRWRSTVGEDRALYSIGYFVNSHWGNEGDFQWHDLPEAGYRVDGRYRRDRHRHPMVVVRNNATGEHFIWQLAWTGGYSFEFDLDADAGTMDQAARLWFGAGPDAPAPLRIVAPGETVTTPEVHLGAVFGDFDATVQSMHDHLRKSVFMPQPRGRGGWVESGIGPEIEITAEDVVHAIDVAAEIGAEVFFVDASWYARPYGNWWSTVGDWKVDLERFPEGLTPFRERAHAKGMLWGLWMDAERLGEESKVLAEHPDWLAAGYDGQRNLGGLLDLTRPEVAAWMEEQIGRVIEENGLEFFRLDHNTHPGAGVATRRERYVENGYMRYYEALYGIYDRLRAKFPDVIFENCAGGGGRTDLGMVRRFSHTWVTDWQIAPRSFAITNGMSMALPPEYVDRLIGGQAGHTTAELDFQWRLLLFVRPTIGFPKPRGAEWNPAMLARMERFVSLYKDFVRPFMNTGRIYHHTPCVANPEPKGWGVLELASRDGAKAVCGLFQLAAPTEAEYLLRLRGLDRSRRYKVTFDNAGQTCEVDGLVLMNQGLTVRLEGALTSELLVIEAV